MIRLKFDEKDVASLGISFALDELKNDYSFDWGTDGEGIKVSLCDRRSDSLSLSFDGETAAFTFDFTRKILFFRLLSLLLERLGDGEGSFSVEENAYFTMNGPMFDVSQGHAVINLDTSKMIFRRLAMMGLNMCMFYCEDSFTVPEEPYFGYMRSRYTYDDIRELDDYAYSFGIELIPCIQTLSHLFDVLKWDVYREIREDAECLLPEDEDTYTFLRHIIKAASAPFRSKRIHIGLDEALDLGRGTYYTLHGYVHQVEIMRRHLERVKEITDELGLRPMLWSDMFFRALGGYRNDVEIPQEFIDGMPKGVDLVYWDYYKSDPEIYRKQFALHKKLAGTCVFAGGIWTWMGFGPDWERTFVTTNAGLSSCKDQGIREVIATVWGDNGTEADVRLNLFGLALFAEHGYAKELDENKLKKRFEFVTGGDWDAFEATRLVDDIPGIDPNAKWDRNPTKFLLYQDPLYSMFDKNIDGLPLEEHYARLAEYFRPYAEKEGPFGDLYGLYMRLSSALELKSTLSIRIHKAYAAGDRKELARLRDEVLPEASRRISVLRDAHYAIWNRLYKPIGWEIYDMRYGSTLIRIDTAVRALDAYLKGERETLPELEEKQLPFNGENGIPRYTNYYWKIVSAGRIASAEHIKLPTKKPKKQ